MLFPDGGNPGEPGGTQRATTGCHDVTVCQEIGLAAGACTGEGVILDISEPVNPKVLSSVEDPNFAFWHSATMSNDGKKVLFTDELGGGGGPECNSTVGPHRGPIDASRLVLGGFWSSYYYNGYIFGSEIHRGFDVFKLTAKAWAPIAIRSRRSTRRRSTATAESGRQR